MIYKEKVLELLLVLKIVDDIEEERFIEEKNKFISQLKEFEKEYMRRIKIFHP